MGPLGLYLERGAQPRAHTNPPMVLLALLETCTYMGIRTEEVGCTLQGPGARPIPPFYAIVVVSLIMTQFMSIQTILDELGRTREGQPSQQLAPPHLSVSAPQTLSSTLSTRTTV